MAPRDLAPDVIRYGGLYSRHYKWREGVGPAAKRPLTYDVYDSWRSIGGTKLSNDGQWIAYATTSQGDDGELIVRHLKTNQEFRHPRGSAHQSSTAAARGTRG